MFIFIPFEPELDRSRFCCGKTELDEWFRLQAGQQERRDAARTTFGVDEAQARIASYFTLVTYRLEPTGLESSPLGRRRYPVPAMLLARLAVDVDYQGCGLGKITLVTALGQLMGVSSQVGFEAVVVDAIDDEAVAFYERFGFQKLSDDGRRLVIATKTLRRTFVETEPTGG